MTKQELITKLHENGEMWANAAFTKAQLQMAYDAMIEAQNITTEELRNKVEGKATVEELWDGDTYSYVVKAGDKHIETTYDYHDAVEIADTYNAAQEDIDTAIECGLIEAETTENDKEENTMTQSTTKTPDIRTLIGHGEMAYDTVYTEGTVSWFKSDEDAYIYVLNTTTKRATRYNAEGQNGKRISIKEYSDKAQEMLDRIKAKEADDEWEAEADAERKAREDKIAADAKATEDAVNGKTRKTEEEIAKLDDAAEDPNVSLEEFCEMLSEDEKATIEPAEAELLNNARKEKKAKEEVKKTARKPRKSKDIAYEGHGVTLTAKQVDFIHHLPDTCFWEKGLDSVIWCDVLVDDIGGQFADKPMTVGAMISTLCEKHLGIRGKEKREGRKVTNFTLTELGKEVAKELGLE